VPGSLRPLVRAEGPPAATTCEPAFSLLRTGMLWLAGTDPKNSSSAPLITALSTPGADEQDF
jgi:hypothetical protein